MIFLTTCAHVHYLHFQGEEDERDLEKLEEKIWEPSSSLSEKQIDQFLVVARYVNTEVGMDNNNGGIMQQISTIDMLKMLNLHTGCVTAPGRE